MPRASGTCPAVDRGPKPLALSGLGGPLVTSHHAPGQPRLQPGAPLPATGGRVAVFPLLIFIQTWASEARQAVGERRKGPLWVSVGHVGNGLPLSTCPWLIHRDAGRATSWSAALGARRPATAGARLVHHLPSFHACRPATASTSPPWGRPGGRASQGAYLPPSSGGPSRLRSSLAALLLMHPRQRPWRSPGAAFGPLSWCGR
jgi:hypothetical protein